MIRQILGEKGVKLPKADDKEMTGYVIDYTRWALNDVRPDEKVFSERRVPLFYKPEDRGTVDVTIFGSDRVVIRDLKYGVGVSVDAEENDQLAIYAESVIQELEASHGLMEGRVPVTMEIYQPRDMHNSEPVRSWTISRAEVSRFVLRHAIAVRFIREGKVAFLPSPKACRWCPASGICKAYATQGLSILNDEETSVDVVLSELKFELPHVLTLTRDQRQRIIAGRKALEKFLEAVEDQEVHELMNGAEPDKYKLVEGKGPHRQWSEPEKAFNMLLKYFLEDDLIPPGDFVSPAQMEKLLKGRKLPEEFLSDLFSLVFKPQGKPTLVPIDDKRPALAFNTADDFVDISTDGSEYV